MSPNQLSMPRSLSLLAQLVTERRTLYVMTRFWLAQRHSGSLMGAWWILVQPLAFTAFYAVIFTFIFPSKYTGSSGGSVSYLLFLLAGLIPWMTMAAVFVASPSALTGNSSVVKNFSFPPEFFAAREVIAALITWVVGIGFILAIAAVDNLGSWRMWPLVIPLLVLQTLTMFGWSLLFSAIGVFVRDLGQVIAMLTMPMMFALPIFYSVSAAPPVLQLLIHLNPFTYMVLAYQDVFVSGSFENPWAWVIFPAVAVLSYLIGLRAFSGSKLLFASAL